MTESSQNRYLALPPSGRGPGVLVLHAWWGLNEFFRTFCDRLAQEGFVVLAPDMFSGKIARTVEEAEQSVSQINEVEIVPPIVLSALDELSSLPQVAGKGLGVIGFSFGGYWSYWLATKKPQLIKAVTVFYSDGEGDFSHSEAAFLGHFAETDPYAFENGESIQALEKHLLSQGHPTYFYTYPGAGLWFFETDAPMPMIPWPLSSPGNALLLFCMNNWIGNCENIRNYIFPGARRLWFLSGRSIEFQTPCTTEISQNAIWRTEIWVDHPVEFFYFSLSYRDSPTAYCNSPSQHLRIRLFSLNA